MASEGNEYIGVRQFYAGKNLFITGCTGFVGKVLLEKLLRSCPDVGNVYLLGRRKRDQNLQQRFEVIFKSVLFDRLREDNPSVFEKVKYVDGDLLADGLGISDENIELLREEVNIVIHSAATVRFDEPLRPAVEMNLIGSKKVLDLCASMKHIEVLVHVSTCYANCDQSVVEERVYEQKYEPERIIEMVQWLDDEALNAIQDRLLGDKPNTYTFTKSLTETMMQNFARTASFAISIVRPSIVVAALAEPVPGWVDNFNGPSGMITATACGLLRSVYSKKEMNTDLIPVDIVVNTILVAARQAALSRSAEVPVFNCAIGSRLPPFTWGDFEALQTRLVTRVIFNNAIRYPRLRLQRHWTLHRLSMLFEHYVPAYLMDKALQIIGKKPSFLKIYDKLNVVQDALTYFTTHQWDFKTDRLVKLHQMLDDADQKEFNIDVSSLKWRDYLQDYVRGLRDFVLKENHKEPSTRFQRLYLIEQLQRAAIIFAVYKTLGIGDLLATMVDEIF